MAKEAKQTSAVRSPWAMAAPLPSSARARQALGACGSALLVVVRTISPDEHRGAASVPWSSAGLLPASPGDRRLGDPAVFGCCHRARYADCPGHLPVGYDGYAAADQRQARPRGE
jgi:hypothetical protein